MDTRKRSKRSGRESHFSPRELAAAIGVSESSLKRWSDEGLLSVERTAGGHRRIPLPEAIRFIREAGLTLLRPDVLGMPPGPGGAQGRGEAGSGGERGLREALLADRSQEARSHIVSLYLDGASLAWIFDNPIRQALARIGEMWAHDPGGVFLEHRATDTCLRVLAELRLLLPPPDPEAPLAIGCAPAGDVYQIPSAMAALIVAEAGFQERNLGADTPLEAVLFAMQHHTPELVWFSLSTPVRHPRELTSGLGRLLEAAGGAAVVVGGRAAADVTLPRHPALHRISRMSEFAAFARGLRTRAGQVVPAASP
jgi:MerR family transcriptional regulator, light-induced transcriptional regulator